MTRERTRRLAAVWFADIVGYTALSARDEDGALAVVDELQRVAREEVESRGGRVVKFMGDAVLVIFDSAEAALRAALALRAAFAESAVAQRYDAHLTFGVHLGDVVEAEDGDVYGGGVNVASRVQGKATAGQVLATRAVVELIRGRPEFRLQPLPPWRRLKGLGFRQLFAVTGEGEPPPAPRRITLDRAVAIGATVGIVAFIGMIIGVGFGDRAGESAEPEANPALLGITPSVELDIGVEHYFAGELDQAVARLAPFVQSPLREEAEAEEALRYLARTQLELGRPDLARSALQQLLNSEPPMALLIPSAESDSLIGIYYDVRTASRRPAEGVPVGNVVVFDLRFASDTDDPGLAEVGPSVAQMLVSELETSGVPVRYPWEILLGYTGEGAYRQFEERILAGTGTLAPATHALLGRVAIRQNQVSISARVYEMTTGGLVVSETVTGPWPDSFFDLVERLGTALGSELGAL